MFCEKAMELVRELHRAPEGQLPAFNVSSRGRAMSRARPRAWGGASGVEAGVSAKGRGQCGPSLC